MLSKLKKIVVAIAIAVVVLSAWLVHSRRESLAAHARREAAHRTALAPYQRDLLIGTSRMDVDTYLASKNVKYSTLPGQGSDGPSYEVSLGEEPGDGFVCDRWSVSILFEFKMALPSDTLREIRIQEIGHCL